MKLAPVRRLWVAGLGLYALCAATENAWAQSYSEFALRRQQAESWSDDLITKGMSGERSDRAQAFEKIDQLVRDLDSKPSPDRDADHCLHVLLNEALRRPIAKLDEGACTHSYRPPLLKGCDEQVNLCLVQSKPPIQVDVGADIEQVEMISAPKGRVYENAKLGALISESAVESNAVVDAATTKNPVTIWLARRNEAAASRRLQLVVSEAGKWCWVRLWSRSGASGVIDLCAAQGDPVPLTREVSVRPAEARGAVLTIGNESLPVADRYSLSKLPLRVSAKLGPQVRTVTLREGDTELDLTLLVQTAPMPPPSKPPPPLLPLPVWATIGGAGLASIGTGVALWVVADNKTDHLDRDCTPSCEANDDFAARSESIKTLDRTGNILLVTGIALAAVGAAGYAFDLRNSKRTVGSVVVGPGGVQTRLVW